MKKIATLFLAVLLILTLAFTLTACLDDMSSSDGTEKSSQSASSNHRNDDDGDDDDDDGTTMGERMALETAKNYLRTMGFSKQGLIEQLEFEGYTTSEATYAVEHCGANWKEQAVKVAKNYLSMMSFSKQGLIEQLEFEGFTEEEAAYGVEQAYK
ncbi:MAG: Ltp family lipoprotein [Clostridia bacterium]|nr:Ltp family lipoprotein [Clostridia bacterium]